MPLKEENSINAFEAWKRKDNIQKNNEKHHMQYDRMMSERNIN